MGHTYFARFPSKFNQVEANIELKLYLVCLPLRIVQETRERKGEACEKYDKVKRVKEKEELLVPACLSFHRYTG